MAWVAATRSWMRSSVVSAPLVQADSQSPPVGFPEESPGGTLLRVGLADGSLGGLVVSKQHAGAIGCPAAAHVDGDVQAFARHSQRDGGEPGGEEQGRGYPIEWCV